MKKSTQKLSRQAPSSDNLQKTLFQCWKPTNSSKSNNNDILLDKTVNLPDPIDATMNEDGDLELIHSTDTFLSNYSVNQTLNEVHNISKLDTISVDENIGDKLTLGIDENALQSTQFSDTTGFDFNSGSVWIYPVNEIQPIRSYQFSIVEQCLHKNTMVVLPTGMGKTFIAAVVMYNFYRWYPLGKTIFMAPTKPLVNQQSDACYQIVGIPKNDMTSMTGQMAPEKRKLLWDTKRVFFLTPQVISNDILRGTVDVNMIKCVVIDEAHKALGDYAFCKVIESISELNRNFRIIALTATPGSDIKAVQNIIDKLLISHIELRSDDSIDIQQYSNNRIVDKFVLPLNDEILKIRNAYYNVIRGPLKRLEVNRVLNVRDPGSLHKFAILTRREDFRKNVAPGMDSRRVGLIESDLAILVTLVHALELLIQYGVKSFYMFLKSCVENTDNTKSAAQQHKIRTEIGHVADMSDYYEKFKEIFDQKSKPVPRNMRHPKLLKLEEVILEHFKKFGKNDTRVMIFSQYRESVYEITEMLSEHQEIKPMEFVGQASGGNRKTVTQKEQLEVVKKFRDGGYNTLVSTCVGEEGLDIGEVDLIINYDSQKSPIRLIQRMGRTGRKREGRIVVLLAEGKEEQSYITSLTKKKSMYKFILNGKKNFQFYQNNPLMIPKGHKPKCHKMKIVLPNEPDETGEDKENKKKTKKKSKLDTSEQTKKTNRKSKARNSAKEKDDDSFNLEKLPDLDLDTNGTCQSIDKTPNRTNQLKLFNESNTLSVKSTKLDSDILDKQKLVPNPPNFRKLFKCLKNQDSNEIISQSFNLAECIDLWQVDEDDFKLAKDNSLNMSNHLDNSSLIEKFEKFYINLMDSISDSEEEIEPDKNDKLNHNKMVIEDTILMVDDKNVKETTLNDLFMDDEDDDLKYLNDIDMISKFCVDETINEDAKPVNKTVAQIKNQEVKAEIQASPILVQGSSTPRSILKKKQQISYSPVEFSPKNEYNFNCSNKNVSMIGMTQALDLLNDTEAKNEDNCDLFDMKSTLTYLFGDLTPNDCIRNNSVLSLDKNSSGKKRIRFDEASILETSGNKKSFRNDSDESLILKKKSSKVIKDLSSSFSNTNELVKGNYSDDSEFDEIIGNNKSVSFSETQEIDDQTESDDNAKLEFLNDNKNKKKIKNKFIMDEAALSGEDSQDDEEEDDSDLKDSFVDHQHHSCDESMYLKYQKSLRDAEENRPSYLTRKLRPITDDIFSQMPSQDSSYSYDSFCVPDDQISFYEKKSKKKKSCKNYAEYSIKQDRFRRIKKLDMTCLNDEEVVNRKIREVEEKKFQMTQLPRKKKLVNDDSDDDIIAEDMLIKSKTIVNNKSLMIIDEEDDDFKLFKAKNNKSFNRETDSNCIIIEDKVKPIVKPEHIKPVELVCLDEDDDEEFNNWINETFAKETPKELDTISNKSTETSEYFSKAEQNDNKTFMSHFNQKNQNISLGQEKPKPKEKNVEKNPFIINSDLPKNNNWIIIDASLLTSAADNVKNIRRIWQQDKVLIQPSLNCDFIISQRNAVIRFKWTELSAASMRDQIIDRYAKCKAFYNNVIVIIIDDRENNRNRSKLFDSVIANLAKNSQILYSKTKTEELSYELYYLSNNEKELGFHLDLECNKLFAQKKKDISFYLTLPNMSVVNCLYLSKNFENISKFCNSSLEELKSKGKMSDRKARKLLKFLIDS